VIATGVDGPPRSRRERQRDLFIADFGNNRVVKVPAGGSPQTLFQHRPA